MKLRNVLMVIASFIALTSLCAQVSFTYQVTDATCSSNGSISITASGGTGTFSYQLESTCLALPLVQQVPVFNNLAPCQYTITVTDGANGASATQTAMVGGNYSSPSLSLFCGSCAIETAVTGGQGPFVYAISSNGLTGPFVNNSPASSPIFSNIQGTTSYWIKVTDACGNFTVETCQTGEGSLEDFTYEVGLDGQLSVTSVTGGTGSLQYTLNSTAGNFNSTTGIFPQGQWGCNMTLTVGDGCTGITKNISLRPIVQSICANFAEGTATLGSVVNGIPPYIFNYYPPTGTTISSTTGILSGLPINANYYAFQVIDACGNVSEGIYKQKKYPLFDDEPPINCTDNSISLFTPEEGCGGGFDADSWPFIVTCLSCNPVETKQVDTSGISIEFTGNLPGNWELAIEDGCEDQMLCKDTVILHVQPFCDSLQASLLDRFICNNGTFSDRAMNVENGVFTLFDANDNVLGTNATGLFFVPDSGSYKVTLSLTGCGSFQAFTSIGYWEPVDPNMFTYIYNAEVSGSCITQYQLVIDPLQGPFQLTGGPNNISLLLDEEYLTSSCQFYNVTSLLPGEYQLAALNHCGVKNIHLPAPSFDLQAIPFGNCPGSGTITVSGAQSLAEWQAWGVANNADIDWANSITDNYSIDLDSDGSLTSQTGSPYTFVNVDAGEHTIYLYTLNSACPVDTVVVFVPEADTLKFDVSSGILCDGSTTTTLEFEVLSGKPPYVIEQVDCNNPALVLATFNVPDSTFSLPGFAIGDHCFRLIDSCITSLDHQFSVQNFQDDIEVEFNCDNTFTLSVDSLNATYTWLDGNGTTVGTSHKINLPNPSIAANYKVLVDIGECVVERELAIPATEIVPTLVIEGPTYFCQNETVTLTGVSNGSMFSWSNGAVTPSITTGSEGLYAATVTNGFGCTATAEFQLTLDLPIAEIQILSGGNGFGLNCFQDSNGVLRVNPLSGVAPFGFEWSNLEKTQTIGQLKTGTFTVIMTDTIGCKDTATVELIEPELFVPVVETYAPKCFGTDDGFIQIPGWSGGAGGVTVQLNGSVLAQAPVNFDNLPAGNFLVRIRDANGCTVDTSLFFTAPQELLLEIGADLVIELGDSVLLDPQISFSPIDSFLWRSNDPSPMTELSFWFKPTDNANCYLTIWDEEGCTVEDKISIRVTKELDIYVPNAFSPNGDGNNDLFTIYAKAASVRTIKHFQVFDRFGEKVFERQDFDPNEAPMGWDGRLNNQPMNPAVFAWKAVIEFIDGRVETLYGDVVLMN